MALRFRLEILDSGRDSTFHGEASGVLPLFGLISEREGNTHFDLVEALVSLACRVNSKATLPSLIYPPRDTTTVAQSVRRLSTVAFEQWEKSG